MNSNSFNLRELESMMFLVLGKIASRQTVETRRLRLLRERARALRDFQTDIKDRIFHE